MRNQNFVTAALPPVQQTVQLPETVQPKRTFNLFSAIENLYTRYTEWSARRDRVRLCKMAAEAFSTDMESAGTLLFLFYGKTVRIDGDPYEERDRLFEYLNGDIEQPRQIEQREAPVHPAWTKAQLAERLPMIEDYDDGAFEPEAHEVTKLAKRLSLQPEDRPVFMQKTAKPKQAPRDPDLEIAIDALIDYTQAAFDEGLIDSEGVLLKGNVAPWAKRGDLLTGPKAKANAINKATNPMVWSLNTSKLWQLNIRAYANKKSATIALREAYQGYVGNVGGADVGEDDED